MSSRSRGAALLGACGPANAVIAANITNTTSTARFLMSSLPPSFYLYPCRLRNPFPPRTIKCAACRAQRARGIRIFRRSCRDVPCTSGLLSEQRRALMAYVIAEPCIGTKDTACVDVCPVDCIHPRKDEPTFEAETQLYIHPTECIDCGACVPVCPVTAIFALEDLPEKWNSFTHTSLAAISSMSSKRPTRHRISPSSSTSKRTPKFTSAFTIPAHSSHGSKSTGLSISLA